MDDDRARKGRRLRALARVCLDSAQPDPFARELLRQIESLAGELFGWEDPEGAEREIRGRLEQLRRESHEVSY